MLLARRLEPSLHSAFLQGHSLPRGARHRQNARGTRASRYGRLRLSAGMRALGTTARSCIDQPEQGGPAPNPPGGAAAGTATSGTPRGPALPLQAPAPSTRRCQSPSSPAKAPTAWGSFTGRRSARCVCCSRRCVAHARGRGGGPYLLHSGSVGRRSARCCCWFPAGGVMRVGRLCGRHAGCPARGMRSSEGCAMLRAARCRRHRSAAWARLMPRSLTSRSPSLWPCPPCAGQPSRPGHHLFGRARRVGACTRGAGRRL